jgi:hypothetical protein
MSSKICLLLEVKVVLRQKHIERRFYKICSIDEGKVLVREIPISYSKHGSMESLAAFKNTIRDREFNNRTEFNVWLQTQLSTWLAQANKSEDSESISISISDSPKRTIDLLIMGEKVFTNIAQIVESIEEFFKTGTLRELYNDVMNNIKKKSKKKDQCHVL